MRAHTRKTQKCQFLCKDAGKFDDFIIADYNVEQQTETLTIKSGNSDLPTETDRHVTTQRTCNKQRKLFTKFTFISRNVSPCASLLTHVNHSLSHVNLIYRSTRFCNKVNLLLYWLALYVEQLAGNPAGCVRIPSSEFYSILPLCVSMEMVSRYRIKDNCRCAIHGLQNRAQNWFPNSVDACVYL